MRSTLPAKLTLLIVLVIAALAAPASPAAADSFVVLRNSSYIFGAVNLLADDNPTGPFLTFDTTGLPTSGTGSLTDARTLTRLGAWATVASSVNATIGPNAITGSGITRSTAGADGAPPGVGSRSWARSVFNVSFELTQPSAFTFSGHYFADSDPVFGGLVGRLQPLNDNPAFTDEFRFFEGSMDEIRSHAGMLDAGTYMLVLVSDPVYVSAPLQSHKLGGFEFAFNVSPAAVSTPEPGTLVLVGTGALLVIRRRWRRR